MNKKNWLFNGDSVTDCHRLETEDQLGTGYVKQLKEDTPEVVIFNRCISGHRVDDLSQRIIQEIAEIKPDLLSILIGINDIWHFHLFDKYTDENIFKNQYVNMLDEIAYRFPKLSIVLIEPFAFPIVNASPDWLPLLKTFQEIVKKIADQKGYLYIPMQTHLNDELKNYQMSDILPDGVHPYILGHSLIKKYTKKDLEIYL